MYAAKTYLRETLFQGLLPTASGLGIPRASPISQSGAIIRLLARHFGMAGQTPQEAAAADVLYETAKDLGANKKMVVEHEEGAEKAESAKMPWALALRLEKMLLLAPSPQEPSSALTYGQVQLFHVLMGMDACKPDCVAALSEGLEEFRGEPDHQISTCSTACAGSPTGGSNRWLSCSAATAARKRIAAYLAGPLRFPATFGDLGQPGGYAYAAGAKSRKELTV
jgi:hypothetical protein